MQVALKDKPSVPFRVPAGIKLITVDARSGQRSSGQGSIIEAFKPGTSPPDTYSVAGEGMLRMPDERSIGTGTGGLY
jgi:penicillin-binding protein 1A